MSIVIIYSSTEFYIKMLIYALLSSISINLKATKLFYICETKLNQH
jgi:hypothetical protein